MFTTILVSLCRYVPAAIAIAAAVSKASQPNKTAASMAGLFKLTSTQGSLIGWMIIAAEATTGSLLLFVPSALFVSIIAASFFVGMGGMVLILVAGGKSGASCGCFGSKGRLSVRLALHDLGLGLMALAPGLSTDRSSPVALMIGALGIGLAFLPGVARMMSARVQSRAEFVLGASK